MTQPPTTGVQVGHRLTSVIEDVAFGGEGVARVSDFVIFVPFVIPGERVELEIAQMKKRFARARLLKVLEPSPDRVEPLCPYFGECGGCQYQHLDYAAQLKIKHKQVTELFKRIGGCAGAQIDPVEPCPAPYGYRNRIMIRSQWDKTKQGLNIGFIRHDNRLVVDIDQCPISEPAINEQIQQVRAHPPPKGGLKVVLRLQPEGWDVPPDSFFQNNFHLLPRMLEVIRERIQSTGVRHLIDAYCGVGFFSLELAGNVDSFAGVEFDHRAIHAARRNAINRDRTNGEFIAGLTEEFLPRLLGRFPAEQTAVIVDPPRRGCAKEVLDLLRSSGAAQILYVSCHPATLARDIGILTQDGTWQLRRVTPLDMFPQTQHVECVADLASSTSRG